MNKDNLYVFYDLALSVQNSTNALKILEDFIFNVIKRFSAVSAGYIFSSSDLISEIGDSHFAVPRREFHQYEEFIKKNCNCTGFQSQMLQYNKKYVYLYELCGLGHFFMISNEEKLTKENFEMIAPILNKLAGSISFALQYHQLNLAKKAADEAITAKSQFLATISHEIRTPLNGVIGMSQLLEETKLNKSQKDLVDKLLFSSHSVLDIINDTLDYSKLENNQIVIENVNFDFVESLRRVIELLRVTYHKNNNKYKINVAKNFPPSIVSDHNRINQVLFNIIGNASKFTKDGNITVDINLLGTEEIQVSIQDDGIGIEESKLDNIFDAYTQAENSISRKFGGTGLGLSISKKLIELIGGDISVESEIDTGTLFKFYFPFEVGKAETAKEIVEPVVDCESSGLINILVVEDNLINQELMNRVLSKKSEYNVFMCNNGQEAVDFFANKSEKIDLIFMDVSMPVMDGYEATFILRERLGSNLPPVVALTANATNEDKARASKVGMREFITKPFKINSIYDAVKRLVGSKS